MHPLGGSLCLLYVPERGTRDAFFAHIGTRLCLLAVEPQYVRIFVPLSVSHWNDLNDPVFAAFHLEAFVLAFLTPTILFFSSFHCLVVWGSDLRIDNVFSLAPSRIRLTHFL